MSKLKATRGKSHFSPSPSGRMARFLLIVTLFLSLAIGLHADGSGDRTSTDFGCSSGPSSSGRDAPCNCNNNLWRKGCYRLGDFDSPYLDYWRRKYVEFADVENTDYLNGPPAYSTGGYSPIPNICKWDGLTVAGVEAIFGSDHTEIEPTTCANGVTHNLGTVELGADCCCPPGTMSWISTSDDGDQSTGCVTGCGANHYGNTNPTLEATCHSSARSTIPNSPAVCPLCPTGRYNPHYSNPYR